MVDSRDIKQLHPCLERGAKELKERMAQEGYIMGISSTYRDNEAQNALYEQGRTKPGNIVTNAKGGQSIHNYRLAFDVFLNIKGQEYSNSGFFDLAGKLWEEMGGQWGGNWKSFVDRPHMEFTGGLTIAQLQAGKKMPDDTRMKWEIGAQEEVEEVTRYKDLSDLPDWAKPTIEKLIVKEYLLGNGEDLDLSEDMVRLFVVLDRAQIFD